MDRTRYDVDDGPAVLGCTLYSHVPAESEERVNFGLNVFYQIDDWTVAQHNAAHETDLAWLNEQVRAVSQSEPQRQIMVFTHHSLSTADERTVDSAHVGSAITSSFANDLSGEVCWGSQSSCGRVGIRILILILWLRRLR